MPGRNAKPVELHIAEGNPNRLTKAALQQRKDSEIHIGGSRLKCPDYVKADPVALKKWRELTKEYKMAADANIDLVKSSDIGILARYCKTFSEYIRLCDTRDRITSIEPDWDRYACEIPENLQFAINDLLRLSVDLQLETAINKKMDQLLKMEDRLFLNPLAKVKNVPQKPKKEKPVSKFAKFGVGTGA